MKGEVDEQLRALVRLPVAAALAGKREELVAWIDTAFNGGLAIPRQRISELGLIRRSSAEAVLADGSLVELETYSCVIDWFGKTYVTQVAANEAEFALMGTMLLDRHQLLIDYTAKTVEVR